MKSFENFTKEKQFDEKQFDEIQKLLNITDDESIYNEIKSLKNDKDKSKLYKIIKNLYNFTHKQDIMHLAIIFMRLRYFDILNKYKKDVKLENNSVKEITHIEIPYGNTTLTVPSRIGHKYIPMKVLPMSDLKKFKSHRRLKVFYNKGLKCVSCSKVGKYFIKSRDRYNNIHFDIYTNNFELMTIDHIKPKKLGGTYALVNLDPMCTTCNTKKGSFYDEQI